MKKHIRILQVLSVCLVMMSGIWIGRTIEQLQAEKLEAYKESLNTNVAVVNQDLGATVHGKNVNYANAVIETFGSDYIVVSAAASQKGLENGTYGAVITFPTDFSSNIVSINEESPKQAMIELSINPNLSEERYIPLYTQLIAMQQRVNNNIAYAYVETVYEQFHAAQDEIAQLLANDETDMEAVRKVSLTNYTEMLDLGDIPQIDFEPSSPEFTEFINSVQSIAENMNQVYVDSYANAQADFALIKNQIAGYESTISDQSASWTEDMSTWASNVSSYAQNVSSYKKTLDNWRLSAEAYFAEQTIYAEAVNAFADDTRIYLFNQLGGLDQDRNNLQTWRANIQSVLNTSDTDIAAILVDAEQISSKAVEMETRVTEYNAAIDDLNVWIAFLQSYQEHLTDPENIPSPELPAVDFPQQLTPSEVSEDLVLLKGDMDTHLLNLQFSLKKELEEIPSAYALENAPDFSQQAPALPEPVPTTVLSEPSHEVPAQPEALTDALTGIVTASAEYNPDNYLNAHTKDNAQQSITKYAGYLASVEESLKSNDSKNQQILKSIYTDYNAYVGQLRTNIFEVHRRELERLGESINGLTNTLNHTSGLNHGIMDSFVSRMPNSRRDSMVNQQVVEATVAPVTYSYSYIRNEKALERNYLDRWIFYAIIILGIAAIVDVLILLQKSYKQKKNHYI